MDKNFIAGFFREPLKTIQRGFVRNFGTDVRAGDKSFFDQRGAVFIKKGEKAISEAGYTPNDPIAIYRPGNGKMVDAAQAMQSNFGWVYACVKAISDEIANIEFLLYEINSKGEHSEVEQSDLLDLLDGVNELQTGAEFKKILASHLELTGNAYIYLMGKNGERVKSFTEQPQAMYLINPATIKLIIDRTTFPYKVDHYEMVDDGRKFTFQRYEIIHVKYPDPNNSLYGMGTVEGIAEWIDNDNYAMEFNRNFFKNGARLSGFFETDMNSVEQVQRLRMSFEEQFTGVKNAYKIAVMPKGVKFNSAQATAKDMDFNALLGMTSDRILAGFRVSKTILGTAESDTNRSTAETADYVFAKRTIKPKMEFIVSYLNEFLVPRFGKNIYLSFNDPVPEDKQFRTEEMKTAVAGKQVITQNEAREQFMGLGPIEDPAFDTLTTAAPQIGEDGTPIDTGSKSKSVAGKVSKPSMPPGAKAVRHAKPLPRKRMKTQFYRNMEVRDAIGKSLTNKIAEFMKSAKKKNVAEMTDDEYIGAIYVHQKARIDAFAPQIKERLAEVNRKQQKVVLENLDDAIKKGLITKGDVLPSKLFDMKTWVNFTIDAVGPLMTEFFGKEFETALLNIGSKPISVFSDENAKAAIDHRISLLSSSYQQSTRDLLAEKLQEGLSAGDSRAELAEKVNSVYDYSNDVRADMVAKTETVAISNMSNKSAWKAAGTVKTVRWYTSEKDNVCPYCQSMNGKTIDIDDDYFKKGDTLTVDGSSMDLSYSDVGGPPLHVNCGCFIRPDSFTPITAD